MQYWIKRHAQDVLSTAGFIACILLALNPEPAITALMGALA